MTTLAVLMTVAATDCSTSVETPPWLLRITWNFLSAKASHLLPNENGLVDLPLDLLTCEKQLLSEKRCSKVFKSKASILFQLLTQSKSALDFMSKTMPLNRISCRHSPLNKFTMAICWVCCGSELAGVCWLVGSWWSSDNDPEWLRDDEVKLSWLLYACGGSLLVRISLQIAIRTFWFSSCRSFTWVMFGSLTESTSMAIPFT